MTNVDLMYLPSRPEGASASDARIDVDIGDLFQALVSRWKLLVACLAATLTCAALYIVVTPARYAATMSVLVDTRERAPLVGDAAPVQLSESSTLVENQMRLLTSNSVLRRVVDDQLAQSTPASGAVEGAGGKDASAADMMTEDLAKSITVKRSDKSNVIDIETRAETPEKAEQIAQALVKAFLATQAQFSAGIADKESKWLDVKIEDLRKRLEVAEQRVQDYRQTQSVVITEGLMPSEQQIRDANAALIAARGRRAEAEAKYAQLLAATQSGSIDPAKETIRSPLLERLLVDYSSMAHDFALMQSTLGPRHPSYVAMQTQIAAQRDLISREMRNVLGTLRHNVDAERKVEHDAEALVDELVKTINGMGEKRLELTELERQAFSLRDDYAKTLGAREKTHAEVISSPNPLLITPPIAQSARVSPKRLPAVLIAVASGVNLWVIAALLLEFRARRQAAAIAGPSATQEAAALVGAEKEHGKEVVRPRVEPAPPVVAPCVPILVPLPTFQHFTSLAEDEEATVSRAVLAMDQASEPYRRAIASIYEALPRRVAGQRSPEIFAVTTQDEKAGASTLTLALALLACERSDRVLVVDGNAKHETLAALLPYLAPASKIKIGPLPLAVCRRDEQTAGEIMLTRFNPSVAMPDRPVLARYFDLVLVDSGPSESLSVALNAELDGIIAVDREQGAGQRRARLTFRTKSIPKSCQ